MLESQALRFRRKGSTLVEAAFVLSGLLVFLFAIFDYGRFIMIRHIVDNAAREGCRLAVAANASDTNSFNYQTTTTIQNAVQSALAGQGQALNGLTIQVYPADASGNLVAGSWTNATAGQNIAVQIDATYTPMLAGVKVPFAHTAIGIFPTSFPIHAKSVMNTEGN